MDKKKIEIAITAVLAAALIAVSINSLNRIRKKPSLLNLPAAKTSAAALALQPEASDQRETQSEYDNTESSEWMRDPFSETIYLSAKGGSDLKLSGIVWDETSPSAIINDKVVNEGDSIGKYTALKIKQESVILNDGSKNIEIIIGK